MALAPTESLGTGIVEGFYGTPWSQKERLGLIDRLGELGFTAFMLAPKNEPSQRARWWERPTRETLDRVEILQARAELRGVELIYGLAPEQLFGRGNLGARGSAFEEGLARLVLRLSEVRARGVRRFVLLFDDTWPTVFPSLATFEHGARHAKVVHAVREALSEEGDVSVAVVPAVYSGRPQIGSRGAIAYLRGLASAGPIAPAWTGPAIFSRYISGHDLAQYQRVTGLRPWIWNNGICNDWLPMLTGQWMGRRGRERLSIGPVDQVSLEALRASSGCLLNGAREAALTELALFEVRQHLDRLPASRLEEEAFRRVFGGADEIARDVLRYVGAHPLSGPHRSAPPLSEAEVAFAFQSSNARARERLILELDRIDQKGRALLASEHPELGPLIGTAERLVQISVAVRLALLGDPAADRALVEARRHPWSTPIDAWLTIAERSRGRARR